MVDYILISISKSFKPAKKLMAIFENKTTKRRKTVRNKHSALNFPYKLCEEYNLSSF
jgi:hypothetical protein